MEKRALVVGLGIAGMASAIGLRQAGWTPVIIEQAPERRTGGYFVGLLPQGRQAAIDLEIADQLHTRNPTDGNTWSLNHQGEAEPGLGFLDQPGKPVAVVRGDIEAALWQKISGEQPIEVRYATKPLHFVEGESGIEVLLRGPGAQRPYRETFDLVVGADGMRSTVRRLVFGPHEEFLTTWNAMICALQLPEQVPGYAEQDSIISARIGRAAWVFGLADQAPTALLTYCTNDIDAQFSGDRVERLRSVFAGMDDPVVQHILDSLQGAPDYLFDSVHQVRMPRWSKGRVLLLGDSAWCLNLYSGLGATSALRGGFELGRMLRGNPDDLVAALAAWEAKLRPSIVRHQRLARLKQQMFVPTSRTAEVLRSLILGRAALAQHKKRTGARFSRATHGPTPDARTPRKASVGG